MTVNVDLKMMKKSKSASASASQKAKAGTFGEDDYSFELVIFEAVHWLIYLSAA